MLTPNHPHIQLSQYQINDMGEIERMSQEKWQPKELVLEKEITLESSDNCSSSSKF